MVITGRASQVELWLAGKLVYSGGLPTELRVAADSQHVITAKRFGEPGKDFTVSVGPDLAASYQLELSFESGRPDTEAGRRN